MSASQFMVFPPEFEEEVKRAEDHRQAGDLSLISYEVKGFEWEVKGLRTVGRAQFKIKALSGAKVTWEAVRNIEPNDDEANLLLGAMHERLDDLSLSTETLAPERQRVLVFAGHMIDAPDRKNSRFPADKEQLAREKINEAVVKEMNNGAGVLCGYAGAASGGDILFQEVCAELSIPTRLYLAIPPEKYLNSSVSKAGPGWVDRFWSIYNKHKNANQLRVLSEVDDAKSDEDYLPVWLRSKDNYSIWQRNNLWMLFNAVAEACDEKTGAPNLTLIALWDGAGGDGPGGTGDLVEKVRNLGARDAIINTKELFGL